MNSQKHLKFRRTISYQVKIEDFAFCDHFAAFPEVLNSELRIKGTKFVSNTFCKERRFSK